MEAPASAVLPVARKEDLIVQEMDYETIVYDKSRNRAHSLNRTVALVWRHCDGTHRVEEACRALEEEHGAPVGHEVVWLALRQLDRHHLLADRPAVPREMSGMSRRDIIRLGIGAAVLPVIASITAPVPASAQTCLPTNAACTLNEECCSGICTPFGFCV